MNLNEVAEDWATVDGLDIDTGKCISAQEVKNLKKVILDIFAILEISSTMGHKRNASSLLSAMALTLLSKVYSIGYDVEWLVSLQTEAAITKDTSKLESWLNQDIQGDVIDNFFAQLRKEIEDGELNVAN